MVLMLLCQCQDQFWGQSDIFVNEVDECRCLIGYGADGFSKNA